MLSTLKWWLRIGWTLVKTHPVFRGERQVWIHKSGERREIIV